MNSATFKDGDIDYVRVSKTIARKAYDDGKPVVLCPVKLRPFGGFRPSCMVDKVGWQGRGFADVVSNFESYNCQLNETGYYAAYYVRVPK